MILSPNKKELYILTFFILFSTIFGAFSLLWMRQKITQKAYLCQNMEEHLRGLNRKNSFLETKIAQAHNPEFLLSKTDGSLKAPRASQIIWAHPSRETDLLYLPSNGFTIAFNLHAF